MVEFKTDDDDAKLWATLKSQNLLDLEFIYGKMITIFDIDLNSYPMQPWQRAMYQLKRSAHDPVATNIALQNLRQWFNFNFTPDTWKRYCQAQLALRSLS
jgi:hypothetical protein